MAEQPKKYEPIEAIANMVVTATGIKPTCGEGHDLSDFLASKATAADKGTRIFVAYHGFSGAELYANGAATDSDVENYTIYIQADKNVRETVNKIKEFLRIDENVEFKDTSNNFRVIAATSGSAMREKGFGVFEMNIRVQ